MYVSWPQCSAGLALLVMALCDGEVTASGTDNSLSIYLFIFQSLASSLFLRPAVSLYTVGLCVHLAASLHSWYPPYTVHQKASLSRKAVHCTVSSAQLHSVAFAPTVFFLSLFPLLIAARPFLNLTAYSMWVAGSIFLQNTSRNWFVNR
jgi:hypothetical protein